MFVRTKRSPGLVLALLVLIGVIVLSMLPAQAQADWQQSLRPDGSAIDWSLDLPATGDTFGLVVIAQGSGCQPVASNENIAAVRQAFPGFAALMVEKYGIAPDAEIADPFRDCPEAYHAHNTATQRVADYAQVIEKIEARPWWNGQLVLFGGSMGGSVMARLLPRIDADAAVLLSTGGGVTFGDLVLATVPEEVRPQLAQQFDAIRAHPDSTEVWSGYSFRFWADALDHREADDMLKTATPLLLVQGGRDTSSPAEIARKAADIFAEQGRCNLTYWEYPGLDHAMADAGGQSRMGAVLGAAADWVGRALSQTEAPPCARPEWQMPAAQ